MLRAAMTVLALKVCSLAYAFAYKKQNRLLLIPSHGLKGISSITRYDQRMGIRNIQVKRAYEAAAPSDGYRVLVDRLWPRGLTKQVLPLDLWDKDLAPTTELRTWFGHDPKRWVEFQKRYREELSSPAQHDRLQELLKVSASRTL